MKKLFVFAISLMLLVVLFAGVPLAQNANPTGPELTVSNLKLGDDRQTRSNPRHDDDDDQEVTVTGTITVTNSGNRALNNLRAEISLGKDASGQKISLADLGSPDIEIDSDGLTLSVGESTEVEIEMRVPEELHAVDKKGRKAAFNIADIIFSADYSGSTLSKTVNVQMEAENKLIIDDASISFNGETEGIDDDDSVGDVKPGNDVSIEFEIENRYDDDEDVGIEDIEITVEGGGDLDVDEEENVGDLNPEETDTVTVEFDVEDDARRGDEELEIILLGEDENGAMHGENWEVTIEIERDDHDISITSLALQPSVVSCEQEAQIQVEVRNTGRRDESRVYIRLSNVALSYKMISERLDLDQDDEVTRTFAIPVPETTPLGEYRMVVETYYDTSRRSTADTITLQKVRCERQTAPTVPETPETTDEAEDNIVVITTQPPTPTPVEASEPTKDSMRPKEDNKAAAPSADEEGFLQSNAFIILMVTGYLAVLCGGAIVAFRLLRK